MVKSLRHLAVVALAVIGLAAASSAKADPMETLNMTFLSGATFSGTVTFAPDYSSVEAVTGILTGYQLNTYGYLGTGSDTISWVWDASKNDAGVPGDISGNWLMDGYNDGSYVWDGSWFNFIGFSYDYTNAPNLILSDSPALGSGTTGNGINYSDPLVSGSITPIPEPSSFWLLGSGLVGLAGMLRRKISLRA